MNAKNAKATKAGKAGAARSGKKGRTGSISVRTEDIFPIIKKWLYSEHDIFLRELVSNAADAITKRAASARTKDEEVPKGRIDVTVSPKARTLAVGDNGVGMTEEEVERCIAQLAFSGAREFVERLRKEGGEGADIIGKFGLGFYSVFMVADRVELETLSAQEGAEPVRWSCGGDVEYEIGRGSRTEPGTTVTLHMGEDGGEFLDEFKARGVLRKYCDFMPHEIFVADAERKKGEGEDEPAAVNRTDPLWRKDPSTLKDDDYKEFFRALHPADPEPLFWIHLRVDHPFTLEGVLYFPKIDPRGPLQERGLRLYCKQVFVSDDVKGVVPDFLVLLKGAIDSSDIPLNVSRSSLQGDPNVKKVANYITKKVAESLKRLFRSDRGRYEAIWPDIALFVKHGCISDDKFHGLMLPYVLFKGARGSFLTLEEYGKGVPERHREKLKDRYVYFERGRSDHALRDQLAGEGVESLETDGLIDPHFLQHLEVRGVPGKDGGNGEGRKELHFESVDNAVQRVLETEGATGEDMKVKELFEGALAPKDGGGKDGGGKDGGGGDGAGKEVELGKVKDAGTPAWLKTDERAKRLRKMAGTLGRGEDAFPLKRTLVVNPNNPLVRNALRIHEKGGNKELAAKLCRHIEDLAMVGSEGLEDARREGFVRRGQELLSELSGLALGE